MGAGTGATGPAPGCERPGDVRKIRMNHKLKSRRCVVYLLSAQEVSVIRVVVFLGSIVVGLFVAASPQGLRNWVDRRLRWFPSLHAGCIQFLDRLVSDLERHYPMLPARVV